MITPKNSYNFSWQSRVDFGLIVHFSLFKPVLFLWFGVGISKGNVFDYNSLQKLTNISLYGPPASIDPSPKNFTEKALDPLPNGHNSLYGYFEASLKI